MVPTILAVGRRRRCTPGRKFRSELRERKLLRFLEGQPGAGIAPNHDARNPQTHAAVVQNALIDMGWFAIGASDQSKLGTVSMI